MDYCRVCGGNARLTCRHFDISAQTFYRWRGRYSPLDLTTLEERTRRPRHKCANSKCVTYVLKYRNSQICLVYV